MVAMTPVAFTTQDEVLTKIVERIRSQIEEFNAENKCFVSLEPEPEEEQRQQIFSTVSPAEGTYDAGMFDGAGNDGVREVSGFIVTVFSEMKLDRPDGSQKLLQHDARGLLALKLKILKALLSNADGSQWTPTNASGTPILTDYIAPVSAGFPMAADSGKHGRLSVTFSANWVWNLRTTESE